MIPSCDEPEVVFVPRIGQSELDLARELYAHDCISIEETERRIEEALRREDAAS